VEKTVTQFCGQGRGQLPAECRCRTDVASTQRNAESDRTTGFREDWFI